MNGSFSKESLARYSELISQSESSDFSEHGSYDFTKCVKPDGSTYGSSGACAAPNRPAASAPAKGQPPKGESWLDKQKKQLEAEIVKVR